MRLKPLAWALGIFIAIYMLVTVIFALSQGSMAWQWWWTIPVGGLFVLVAITFRILVQRSAEAADRADRAAHSQELPRKKG